MVERICNNCYKTNCEFCNKKTRYGFEAKDTVVREDEKERIIKIIEEEYDKSKNIKNYYSLDTLLQIIIRIKKEQ